MNIRAAHPLRPLTQKEEQTVQRIVKASNKRANMVKRARAIGAARTGNSSMQVRRRRATRVERASARWWGASTSGD